MKVQEKTANEYNAVRIDPDGEIFIDNVKLKAVKSYKLENTATEIARFTVEFYVNVREVICEEQMNNKALDCMAQHIKTFHDQSVYEDVADFGEPCKNCSHKGECSYDWLSVMNPLLKRSSVQISMVHQERSNKPDIDGMDRDQDKDIHQQEGMNMHLSCNRESENQSSEFQNS